MADNSNSTEQGSHELPSATQNLRALAQSHLLDIEEEISAEAIQQETAARQLEKYAKTRRKDRPKQSPLPAAETKSAKLRSAQDVLNRLRHDNRFNLADYRVGYLERFEGIKEMPVQSWITESTDEDWIPQHRIKYVKRVTAAGGEEIVWDRESRVDLIFGSGRALIADGEESEAGGVMLPQVPGLP